MENVADVLYMVEPRHQADESVSFLSLFSLATVALPPFVPLSREDLFILLPRAEGSSFPGVELFQIPEPIPCLPLCVLGLLEWVIFGFGDSKLLLEKSDA